MALVRPSRKIHELLGSSTSQASQTWFGYLVAEYKSDVFWAFRCRGPAERRFHGLCIGSCAASADVR
jgi:hypothetical protein